MKAFLLYVSILFLSCVIPCNAQDNDTAIMEEYTLHMNVRGKDITGLCLMELTEDGIVTGTIVNEFGVKAFDFTYVNGKIKILNAIAFLDKWYIRKVLRKDFLILLSNMHKSDRNTFAAKKRTIKYTEDGSLVMTNHRHKISYTFSPIEE